MRRLFYILIFLTLLLQGCNSRSEKNSAVVNKTTNSKTEDRKTGNSGINWSDAQIDYYNPFGLENSKDCPIIPGLFFKMVEGKCETYMVGIENTAKFARQPLYRFTVVPKFNAEGEAVFEVDQSKQPSCLSNPKIRLLVGELAGISQIEVTAGFGELDEKIKVQSSEGSVICRVRVL